jgi:hypothetical protein
MTHDLRGGTTVSDELQVGTRVRWNTPQGETTGRVVEVATSRTAIEGQTLDASKDDPRYIVESDATGARAGHTRHALTREDDTGPEEG